MSTASGLCRQPHNAICRVTSHHPPTPTMPLLSCCTSTIVGKGPISAAGQNLELLLESNCRLHSCVRGRHQREYSLGIKSSSLPSRPQGGNIRWDEISLLGRQLRLVMPRPQMSSMPAQGISIRAGWYNSSTAGIVGEG